MRHLRRIRPYAPSFDGVTFDIAIAGWCILAFILLGAAAGLVEGVSPNPLKVIRSR